MLGSHNLFQKQFVVVHFLYDLLIEQPNVNRNQHKDNFISD